jgi:hypothetical protein
MSKLLRRSLIVLSAVTIPGIAIWATMPDKFASPLRGYVATLLAEAGLVCGVAGWYTYTRWSNRR